MKHQFDAYPIICATLNSTQVSNWLQKSLYSSISIQLECTSLLSTKNPSQNHPEAIASIHHQSGTNNQPTIILRMRLFKQQQPIHIVPERTQKQPIITNHPETTLEKVRVNINYHFVDGGGLVCVTKERTCTSLLSIKKLRPRRCGSRANTKDLTIMLVFRICSCIVCLAMRMIKFANTFAMTNKFQVTKSAEVYLITLCGKGVFFWEYDQHNCSVMVALL